MKEFDDQEAIQFILSQLPAEAAARYDEDAVQYFIDTLFDYFEDNGMLDIDFDDDADADELQAVAEGLTPILTRDRNYSFAAGDIALLVAAEAAYEQSLL